MIRQPPYAAGRMRHAVGLLAFLFVPVSIGAAAEPRAIEPFAEWQYRWGESPPDPSGVPRWAKPAGDAWTSLPRWGEWETEPARETLWLRTVLPARLPDQPALFLEELPDRWEIYVDGRRLDANWPAMGRESWHVDTGVHRIVPLPTDAGGKSLVLRVWDRGSIRLSLTRPTLGAEPELRIGHLHQNAIYGILGILYLAAGLIALGGAPFLRQRRALIFFAMLALCFGWLSLGRAGAFTIIFDWPVLRTAGERLGVLSLGLAIPALLAEFVSDKSLARWLTRLSRCHALFLIAAVFLYAAHLVHPTYLEQINLYLLAAISTAAVVILAFSLRRGDRKMAVLLVLGVLPFCLSMVIGVTASRLIDETVLSLTLPIGFAFLVIALARLTVRNTFAALQAQVSVEAVRHSEARFRALSQNAADMVFLLDAAGRYLFANSPCFAGTGLRPEELYDSTVFDRVHPDDVGTVRHQFNDLLERPGDTLAFEYRHSHSDGSWRNHEARASNHLTHPDVRGIVVNARDITGRRAAEVHRLELESRIQQSQKLESLGGLAAGIAHEFNNLLVGILGNAGLAQMNLPPASPVRPSLAEIERSARHAADLCKQMLAYSGRRTIFVQPLCLNDLIREMEHLLAVCVSKKAALKYHLGDHQPAIEADAAQIRQVLINLVTNASEAIGDGTGQITVVTGLMRCDRNHLDMNFPDAELTEGDYVFCDVSDTGSGMSEATRLKVFEPFFTTKLAGRGLGLPAVLGIVRGHKGAIEVRSELGRGSTFIVRFPASDRSLDVRSEPASSGSEWRGQGTILLVDDDDSVRTVAQRSLEMVGFTVLAASGGEEALDLFRDRMETVRLVLLDLSMPRMSGEETFRQLRILRPDAKVILFSGYNETEATERFAGRGLAGFLQKPWRPNELTDAIRKALGE